MNCDALDYQDDDAGRFLVIYQIGLSCWSYSLDGKPAGKSFATRAKAVRAAQIALENKDLKPLKRWRR